MVGKRWFVGSVNHPCEVSGFAFYRLNVSAVIGNRLNIVLTSDWRMDKSGLLCNR